MREQRLETEEEKSRESDEESIFSPRIKYTEHRNLTLAQAHHSHSLDLIPLSRPSPRTLAVVLENPAAEVGLELVPRDYDMDTASPFRRTDIITMILVYKVDSNPVLDNYKDFTERSDTQISFGVDEHEVSDTSSCERATCRVAAIGSGIGLGGPYHIGSIFVMARARLIIEILTTFPISLPANLSIEILVHLF